jgi:ABC-type nitrate/sulfonate/bicarbonate transport system substrate-binding protein
MQKKSVLLVLGLALLILIMGWLIFSPTSVPSNMTKVVYGISPYQDTMIPVLAEKKGWYAQEGLDVEIKILPWGEVMSALASGAIDVALQNFNSFEATAPNINQGGGDVIYYAPFYVFKGAAIMVRPGEFATFQEMKSQLVDSDEALVKTVQQLKGKTIFLTKGTEMEEIVTKAIEKAGLSSSDVTIIHAQPEDSLAAFLQGEGDGFSAGVTEHLKAHKEIGAVPLVTAGDLGIVVIDGLVTRKSFAEAHPEALQKLKNLWFQSISYIDRNFDDGAGIVIQELNENGSYTFDMNDYRYTWEYTQFFPKTEEEAHQSFLDEQSPFYWQKTWDAINSFLLSQNSIPYANPLDWFWGKETLTSSD